MFLGDVRVAIAGVGNCCSSLVQGIKFYRNSDLRDGLINKKIGVYDLNDVKFVAAFDIDKNKVGYDLSDAIFAHPNKVEKIIEVSKMGVEVLMGPCPDLIDQKTMSEIQKAKKEPVNVSRVLKEKNVDVLVNIISGGSDKASKMYAEACLEAECAYLNATPTEIVNDPSIVSMFEEKGLPVVGDDLMSQIGATAIHIGLLEFLHKRGVKIEESYQLDVGGGSESINTLEKTREIKREIKTAAVLKSVPYDFPLVSGSADFVDFLINGRDSFFYIKGKYFGNASFILEVKLSTQDAFNSGSILIDCILGLKIAFDKEICGVVEEICSYGFKRPLKRYNISESEMLFNSFVEEN
jgi:myo-inositol-1-phosphate synthase